MRERYFQINWGPTLENTLVFQWPVVGANARAWRDLRDGAELVINAGSTVSWLTGRWYKLSVQAKYFAGAQNFGATGLQAFFDWAMDSNQFTLMPFTAMPTLTVTGCYLEAPKLDINPSVEKDGSQTVELTIMHQSVDLGLAWRGMWFEYAAGGSLTDPVAAAFTRASTGYELSPYGYLLTHIADNLCDGHYPGGIASSGVQTTLIEQAVTNDITNPEDLSNASWDKTDNVTITANNARAPDQNITADLIVETVTASVTHTISSNAFTIVAGDRITAIAFVRDGGRPKGRVTIGNAGQTITFGLDYDLSAGTIAAFTSGGGVLDASRLTLLAGGWYMIWWRGQLDPATTTSAKLFLRLKDASGATSYTGDGASGTYFWGTTAVHGAGKVIASYTPTTSAKDSLNYAYNLAPQAAWWYIKHVEGGGVYTSSVFSRIAEIGVSEFASPSWNITWATSGSSVTLKSSTGATIGASAAGTIAVGDVVELLLILYSDGSIELHQSVNGGAETSGGRSAVVGGGMPSTWGVGAKLGIGDNPTGTGGRASATQTALIKHGPFVATGPFSVATIAAARWV